MKKYKCLKCGWKGNDPVVFLLHPSDKLCPRCGEEVVWSFEKINPHPGYRSDDCDAEINPDIYVARR